PGGCFQPLSRVSGTAILEDGSSPQPSSSNADFAETVGDVKIAARFGVVLALLGSSMHVAPASATAPTCFGAGATMVGTAKADQLAGGPGRDVIVGLGGNDALYGLGGGDLVCGGPGDDAIYGDD